MNKRTAFKLCIAGAAAVMLAACGKDEPKPAPAAKDVKTAAQPAAAAKEPM